MVIQIVINMTYKTERRISVGKQNMSQVSNEPYRYPYVLPVDVTNINSVFQFLSIMQQIVGCDIWNSRFARYVHFWGLVENISSIIWALSADRSGRSWPFRSAQARSPLNSTYHPLIVLSVCVCMTIDSLLAIIRSRNISGHHFTPFLQLFPTAKRRVSLPTDEYLETNTQVVYDTRLGRGMRCAEIPLFKVCE